MNTWIYISIIAAVINWMIVFQYTRRRKSLNLFEYFTKPVVIILLFIWLYGITKFQGHSVWFALGLLFSLIGDVVLMISSNDRGFIIGAISFVFTFICYIIGLNDKLPVFNLPAILITVFVAITSLQTYILLTEEAIIKREKKIMVYLIGPYLIVLSLMLISALLTYTQGERWNDGHAILIGSGALLFYSSDIIIIWNKYIRPIQNAKFLNRISYHIGQICIIVGATLHLVK
jgi:uncharacterized membrane protein YhhN